MIERTNILISDPPRDNGGADIQQYHLEVEESKGSTNNFSAFQ